MSRHLASLTNSDLNSQIFLILRHKASAILLWWGSNLVSRFTSLLRLALHLWGHKNVQSTLLSLLRVKQSLHFDIVSLLIFSNLPYDLRFHFLTAFFTSLFDCLNLSFVKNSIFLFRTRECTKWSWPSVTFTFILVDKRLEYAWSIEHCRGQNLLVGWDIVF